MPQATLNFSTTKKADDKIIMSHLIKVYTVYKYSAIFVSGTKELNDGGDSLCIFGEITNYLSLEMPFVRNSAVMCRTCLLRTNRVS